MEEAGLERRGLSARRPTSRADTLKGGGTKGVAVRFFAIKCNFKVNFNWEVNANKGCQQQDTAISESAGLSGPGRA